MGLGAGFGPKMAGMDRVRTIAMFCLTALAATACGRDTAPATGTGPAERGVRV